MTTEDQLNAIHLDWANGKVTLANALREAYGLGRADGWDDGYGEGYRDGEAGVTDG